MKEKIRGLLKERNAIMLSHNYQPPEIQDMADLCGDSLELSIKAAQTDAEVIVFCGDPHEKASDCGASPGGPGGGGILRL